MTERRQDAPDTVPGWDPDAELAAGRAHQQAAEPAPPRSAESPAPGTAAGAPVAAASWERKVLEELAFAALRERTSARRWALGFRLAWLVLAAAFVYFAFIHPSGPAAPTGPHTAVVDVRGEISAESLASAERINRALRAAFAAHEAKAVVLRINSPGGSPVQSGLINDEIRRLKALHGKPIYAVVEEAAASGAYYIAVAADRVFVDKASVVGSIGVLMNGFGFTGLMEKLGVERRLIVAGEKKALLDPFSPQSERDRQHAQDLLRQIHAQFIAAVRQGRGDRLKEGPDTFSGLIWSGEQAVQLGLADDLAGLEHVAREVVQAERIIDYTLRDNVAERLARRLGAGVGESVIGLLDGGGLWR